MQRRWLFTRFVMLSFLAGSSVLFHTGCTFMTLKKEMETLDHTAQLFGTITNESPQRKPIIILLYEDGPTEKKLVDYFIIHQSGTFHFVAPPGQYVVAAFEDANEDLTYQQSEKAGYYGTPSLITLEPGKKVYDINVTLQLPHALTLSEAPNLSHPAIKSKQGLSSVHLGIGEVINLEDARFTPKNGRMGLWEPIRFWESLGGGIFFLEPYSTEKTPVLFVHGAGGHPKEWASIIDHLDRSRFQPWVAFYPSGFRLHWIVEGFGQVLREVFVTYKFEKLIVIAHSMGGLISRSLLNDIAVHGVDQDPHLQLITISTPWGGHQSAQLGVVYAPAVIPSWVDMVPHSPFQQQLFKTPWPDSMKFYLMFSFKGGRNPFTNGNDDGTVSLISQLQPEAQEAADWIYGFNEDHTSILKSQAISEKINELILQFP